MSQDVLVTTDIVMVFKVGDIHKVENDIIYFTDKSSEEKLEFSTRKISSLSFHSTGDTIIYPEVRYNLIDCKIQRIGRNSVEYRLPGSVLGHNIEKNKVFACIFENSPQSEKAWYFKTIFEDLEFYFKIKRKEKLIRINGQERIVKIDSLINGIIYFKTHEKKQSIKSSISNNKVSKLYFASFLPSPYKNNFTDYVLTKNDSFLSGRVVEIFSESISFNVTSTTTNSAKKLSLSKQDIIAVYFCEFENIN